jgi:hypothetical protein
LTRIRFGSGSRREEADDYVRSPDEVAERAQAALEAHYARVRNRLPAGDRFSIEALAAQERAEEAHVPLIEAAVEEGLQRLRQEAERRQAETEAWFAELSEELEHELALRSAELATASERQTDVADRLAAEISRLYRLRMASHPASIHLAELHARIKELAQNIAAAGTADEPAGPGSRSSAA